MSVPSEAVTQRVLSPAEFAWLADFLLERTGIELKPGKESMVMGRLDRRLRHHELDSYRDYFRLMAADQMETQLAVDLLTTNETYFFREPKHFELLRKVVGAIGYRGEPIRVWSAASSSGEEAYTIAMTLADAIPAGRAWEVLGTDISRRVLETARRGLYPIEAAEKIPPNLLREYCLRGRDEYEGFLAIHRSLRDKVRFRAANLIDLPHDLGRFDVIFLRNVMIYFGTDTKRELLARVIPMLRPGGYLLISHAESLNGLQEQLQLVAPSVYRLETGDG
jgi:chemotaxis protein methyltransferase CheR